MDACYAFLATLQSGLLSREVAWVQFAEPAAQVSCGSPALLSHSPLCSALISEWGKLLSG